MRSPVTSNSTQGMTLLMNLRKMRRAKCDSILWPDSTMESDMVLRTAAWRQGCTVGMVTPSRKGNFSIVSVLSRYSRWMSRRMSSLETGVPSWRVALKYMRGVWQYSSQTMYILQQRQFSMSSSSSLKSPPSSTTISSSPSWMTLSSTLVGSGSLREELRRRRQRFFSSSRYCCPSSRYLLWNSLLSEAFHCHPLQILMRWFPARLNSSGDSSPVSWNMSFSGGGLHFLPSSCAKLLAIFLPQSHQLIRLKIYHTLALSYVRITPTPQLIQIQKRTFVDTRKPFTQQLLESYVEDVQRRIQGKPSQNSQEAVVFVLQKWFSLMIDLYLLLINFTFKPTMYNQLHSNNFYFFEQLPSPLDQVFGHIQQPDQDDLRYSFDSYIPEWLRGSNDAEGSTQDHSIVPGAANPYQIQQESTPIHPHTQLRDVKASQNRNKKQKAASKQSKKHNFSMLLVRQIRNVIKKHLQANSDQSLKTEYLRFVFKNVRQTRKSLIEHIIFKEEENMIQAKFQEFIKSKEAHLNPKRIEMCKKHLREIFIKEAQLRNLAAQMQFDSGDRKQYFSQFMERTIADLKNNQLRGKDIKSEKANGIQEHRHIESQEHRHAEPSRKEKDSFLQQSQDERLSRGHCSISSWGEVQVSIHEQQWLN